ncbi:unnamed protein product, partial [Scytosiphon promiscuus]
RLGIRVSATGRHAAGGDGGRRTGEAPGVAPGDDEAAPPSVFRPGCPWRGGRRRARRCRRSPRGSHRWCRGQEGVCRGKPSAPPVLRRLGLSRARDGREGSSHRGGRGRGAGRWRQRGSVDGGG